MSVATVDLPRKSLQQLFTIAPIGDTQLVASQKDAPPSFLLSVTPEGVFSHYKSQHPSTCRVDADSIKGTAVCVLHHAEAVNVAALIAKGGDDATLTIDTDNLDMSITTGGISTAIGVHSGPEYDAYAATVMTAQKNKKYKDSATFDVRELLDMVNITRAPIATADYVPGQQRYMRFLMTPESDRARIDSYSPWLCITSHAYVDTKPSESWTFLIQPATIVSALTALSSAEICTLSLPQRGSYIDLTYENEVGNFFFRLPAIFGADDNSGILGHMDAIDNMWNQLDDNGFSSLTININELSSAHATALQTLGATGVQLQNGKKFCRLTSIGTSYATFTQDVPISWLAKDSDVTHNKFKFNGNNQVLSSIGRANKIAGHAPEIELGYSMLDNGSMMCVYTTDGGEITIHALAIDPNSP